MGCNCNQQAVTKYRLTRPDQTYTDFDTLDEARHINDTEVGGKGIIRTVRTVVAKTKA
jgi:uncharacterized RmlC-like cupin family protein